MNELDFRESPLLVSEVEAPADRRSEGKMVGGSAPDGHGGSQPPGIRALGVALIGVALVIAVGVASVLMLGSPRVATYPDGSPEAALQRYVAARAAGDEATAQSLLSSSARYPYESNPLSSGDFSVSIDSVDRQSQSRAMVTVTIARSYSGNPGGPTDYYSIPIQMVYEDGGWKLDGVPYGL